MEIKMCFFASFRIRRWIQTLTWQEILKLPVLHYELYTSTKLMLFWIFVHMYHCLLHVVCPFYFEQRRLNFINHFRTLKREGENSHRPKARYRMVYWRSEVLKIFCLLLRVVEGDIPYRGRQWYIWTKFQNNINVMDL